MLTGAAVKVQQFRTATDRVRPAGTMVHADRRRAVRDRGGLERFDIDVVICRSGDPDRRQLRSTARLASYRREEG